MPVANEINFPLAHGSFLSDYIFTVKNSDTCFNQTLKKKIKKKKTFILLKQFLFICGDLLKQCNVIDKMLWSS